MKIDRLGEEYGDEIPRLLLVEEIWTSGGTAADVAREIGVTVDAAHTLIGHARATLGVARVPYRIDEVAAEVLQVLADLDPTATAATVAEVRERGVSSSRRTLVRLEDAGLVERYIPGAPRPHLWRLTSLGDHCMEHPEELATVVERQWSTVGERQAAWASLADAFRAACDESSMSAVGRACGMSHSLASLVYHGQYVPGDELRERIASWLSGR